jgi:NarL family two-component system response regulator LiaR
MRPDPGHTLNGAYMNGDEIRVLVVDDHDLFRTGLASLLDAHPDISVIAQASGGRMGVRLAAELLPNVVLIDVRMPDLTGPDATRRILEANPDIRVVALTVVTEHADVAAVLESGACGFLAKDTPIDSIAVAIRAAAQGAAWLSPRAAEVALSRVREYAGRQSSSGLASGTLSPREVDVLRLLAEGLENTEIALELGISPRTAKNHVSSILSKLGLNSRVQAAIYAIRQGLS